MTEEETQSSGIEDAVKEKKAAKKVKVKAPVKKTDSKKVVVKKPVVVTSSKKKTVPVKSSPFLSKTKKPIIKKRSREGIEFGIAALAKAAKMDINKVRDVLKAVDYPKPEHFYNFKTAAGLDRALKKVLKNR